MALLETLLALVAACIGFALLARRLRLPYAVMLVLGGMLLAFIPGLPEVRLEPELALAFFLPPLLQASAYRTDWRSFRVNLRPILLLALGCVAFTAVVVAWVARQLLPELPWAAAIALGAIVAPPDAVAAAAVLQRLRLPRRLVTVLEGESLVNDASALLIYRFAVLAAVGGAVTPLATAGSFLLLSAGGMAVGFAIGRAATWALPRLEDTALEIAGSFLACYASYLGAEAIGVSGVIAVVTTGGVLGLAQHEVLSSRTRLEARTVWDFVEFLLNSLVFILIGLQLHHIMERLSGRGMAELLGLAAMLSVVLVAARFAWIWPATWLPRRLPGIRRWDPMPGWREVFVIGWAGMRGVVSLAAALALPYEFPERDLIVFLAFAAILATLVLQGTTLEWVVKRLGVELPPHPHGIDPAEAEARRLVAEAAVREIEGMLDDPLEGAIAADLLPEFRDRAGHLQRTAANHGASVAERTARRRIRLLALEASRQRLLRHGREDGLHAESLARLAQELDMEELRIRQVLGDERTARQKEADKVQRWRLLPSRRAG